MADSKELQDKVLEAIEIAKSTGKIRKGTNEVTKALEKGIAKVVAIAGDVTPPEVVMHIPILAKEKGVPCVTVGSKEELGSAAGLPVSTSGVAVVQDGESKNLIKQIVKETGAGEKPAEKPAEEPKEEEKKEEAPKKEKKEEKKEEAKEEKAEKAKE